MGVLRNVYRLLKNAPIITTFTLPNNELIAKVLMRINQYRRRQFCLTCFIGKKT